MVSSGAPALIRRSTVLAKSVESRMVLFDAPGGSGKTTAAGQLIDAWEVGSIRVRFRPGSSMARAVDELRRATRRAGLGDIAEMMSNADGDPNGALDAFVGAANELAIEHVLLLDDVHHLDHDVASELVNAVIDLPATARLVVTARDLGPFVELRSQTHATVIDAEDLRFDDHEIAAVIGSESSTLVAEVAAATTGWCAAVNLVAQRLRVDPAWSPSTPGSGRALLDDLIADVLHADPALTRLGAVPLIDETIATLLDDTTMFARATRAGVLARHRGQWWVVPDPIRESPKFAETLPLAASRVVADHYRASGELHAALSFLIDHDDDAFVEFVATLHWTELEAVGVSDLLSWIDRIDPRQFASRPTLLVAIAHAIELAAPNRRGEFLELAVQFVTVDSPEWRSVQAEIARDLVNAARLDEARSRAHAVAAACNEDETITEARALATVARVDVFECSPDSLRRGADAYARAAELFRAAGETRWLAETLARRGYTALYMGGAPHEGELEMRAALALLPTGDFTRGFWLTNYSDVLDYLGRVPEAEAAAREALDIGVRRRDRAVEGMAWWSLTWIAAHRGDHEAFTAAFAGLQRTMGEWVRPGQAVEIWGSTGELMAMLGDHAGFDECVRRGAACPAAAEYPTPLDLARARYLALYGDADEAAELLARLDTGVALVPSNRPTRIILHALAEARRGNVDLARRIHADAQAAATAMGVADLLARYAGPVVTAIETLTDSLSPDVSDTTDDPAPIVRMLGAFSVERGGQTCTPQPGHPAALVKLLALTSVMTVDAAIDTLWPEADLGVGRSRLRNLLNRLKQRAGDLVVRDGETLRLQANAVCDVRLFEERAATALGADADERVGLARGAIGLYTGELLPGDVYEDWTLGPRERTKRRYLALIDIVADDAIARGDTEEAIRLLDLGMEAEPLDEARYLRMCDVLVAQGRIGTAREVAARAVATLDEIGESVDPRLRALL